MDASAELTELDAAAGQLQQVADGLRGSPDRLAALVGGLADAAGLATARRACHRAGEGLVPAARDLVRSVQRLSDDAAGQAWRFRLVDGAP